MAVMTHAHSQKMTPKPRSSRILLCFRQTPAVSAAKTTPSRTTPENKFIPAIPPYFPDAASLTYSMISENFCMMTFQS